MALASWSDLLERLRPELKGSAPSVVQRRRGAAEFVEWAEREHVPLKGFDTDAVLKSYTPTLDVHKKMNGSFTKQGEACLTMAKELLEKAASFADDGKSETPADPVPPTDITPTETDMPKNEQELEMQDEQFTEAEEQDADAELFGDEDEVVEEEERPRPARNRRPAPVQVQYVPVQPRGRPKTPPVERASVRSAALKGILPRTEKVRLYKRNELGKREFIEDFTIDEIGDMKLEAFIREYIHPQFGNEGTDTQYIAYEVDPRTGKEKQPPSELTLRGEAVERPHDPFNQVRSAFSMLQDLQSMAQPGQQPQQKNPMVEMAQQQAAAKGDVNSMFMLMMMEKMFERMNGAGTNPNADLLMKLLDRVEKMERRERVPERDFGGPPPGFGGPPTFGGFPPPFAPPYPPPPPRFEREERGTEKLLDLAMAKLAQPPPSLADSVKELMALQTIMQPKHGDSSEVAALRAELRGMADKLAPRPADSLESSLATFEKLTTIAKSVTQQTGGSGDVGGFLKNFITPEVGKAIGGIVAGAVGQQQQQAQQVQMAQVAQAMPQPAPMPVQVQPAAPTPPKPRDPNSPPLPPPPQVAEAVKLFRFAQTPEVQAQRFVDVVFSMWLSEDPFYRKLLQPALEDLNKAEESVDRLKAPRRLALLLINDMVPKLATPDFADACIAAMANKAGVEQLPATLMDTRGKWTLRNDEVVLLEDVGVKAVPPEPAPERVESRPAAPEPVPLKEVVAAPAAIA